MNKKNQWQQDWEHEISVNGDLHPVSFMEDAGYTQVDSDVVGTWRWGTINETVFSDGTVFVKVKYMDASGDSDIDAYGMMAEFTEVAEAHKLVRWWKPVDTVISV